MQKLSTNQMIPFKEKSDAGKDKTIHFICSEFFSTLEEFKKYDFSRCETCSSKYGGLIAATYASFSVFGSSQSTEFKDRIFFFYNNGLLKNSIYLKKMEGLVLFEFTEDEKVVCLYSNGNYHLVDSHGDIIEGSVSPLFLNTNEKIIRGRISGNTIMYCATKERKYVFYLIRNINEPKSTLFFESQIKSTEATYKYGFPFAVVFVNESSAKKIQLVSTNNDVGVTVVKENEKPQTLMTGRDGYVEIKNILIMTVSATGNKLAILTENKKITVVSVNFDKSSTWSVDSPIDEGSPNFIPRNLFFCGDFTLIVVFMSSFAVLPKGFATNKLISLEKTLTYFFFQELDGLRIIIQGDRGSCLIFREVTESYSLIFKKCSTEDAAMLYTACKKYLKKEPSLDQDTLDDKKKLAKSVVDCLDAAVFEVNAQKQKKLLLAVAYGKAFLTAEQINQNMLFEETQKLKILHNLRHETIFRPITSQQFQYLTLKSLIRLLLLNNEHALCLKILETNNAKQNEKDEMLNAIYVDWAKKKANSLELEDTLANIIISKLKNQVGIPYVEIANYAWNLDPKKKKLAARLVELESNSTRKIPMLLTMQNFEKAFEEADKSKDSNLIYLCISKLIKSGSNLSEKYLNLFSTKMHIITFLNYSENKPYQFDFLRPEEKLMFYINEALKCNVLERYVEILKDGAKSIENIKDKTLEPLQKLINIHNDLTNKWLILCRKDKTLKPKKTVGKILEDIMRDTPKEANGFQKATQFSDKRSIYTQLMIYIENKEWDKMDKFIAEKNKRQIMISYEDVLEMLKAKNESQKAIKFIEKIPEDEIQIYYWIDFKLWIEGCNYYFDKKKIEFIKILKDECQDEPSKNYIEKKKKALEAIPSKA